MSRKHRCRQMNMSDDQSGTGSTLGCSKWSSNETAGEKKAETYPLWYVEHFFDPRTKVAAVFSILSLAVVDEL